MALTLPQKAELTSRRRKAKRLMLDRLVCIDKVPVSFPLSADPALQKTIGALFLLGYGVEEIVSASGSRLSTKEVLSVLRAIIAFEIREVLPLTRSTLTQPLKGAH